MNPSLLSVIRSCLAVLALCSTASAQQIENNPPNAANIRIHSGESVAFLGASISEYGWNHPTGYIQLAINNLAANGVRIATVPAGASGNTSRDMLAHLDRDVLIKSLTG